jgi:N-acetylated-alpha-linked acidic dipeptidase
VSLRDRAYARKITNQPVAESSKNFDDKHIKLGALGAGSDWSGFLQHLGITTLNLDFAGEGEGGEYHSIYDTYDHYTKFQDPGLEYVIALAKTAGRVMMRMANAEVLPIDYKSLAETVNGYKGEIKTLLGNMRTATEMHNKMVKDNLFTLADDPQKKLSPAKAKDTVPHLDFSEFETALDSLKSNAEQYEKLYATATNLSPEKEKELNSILNASERKLINENGLPGRPWYRHQVYAPGLYTGYGVKTLPGIREAVEQRKWAEAQENIHIVSIRLKEYNESVKRAIAILNQHL